MRALRRDPPVHRQHAEQRQRHDQQRRERRQRAGGQRGDTGQVRQGGEVVHTDLRELYLMASGNAVLWTMLGQAAQASRDSQLLQVVSDCHPRTLRQVRWCNGTIKTLSPQILTSI